MMMDNFSGMPIMNRQVKVLKMKPMMKKEKTKMKKKYSLMMKTIFHLKRLTKKKVLGVELL